MLNVGVHFIDLISSLTNAPITHVSAQMRTYRPDVTVEEQAVFTCRNAAGQIGVVETGYLYPSTAEDQRDFAFSISHTSSYIRGYADQLYLKARDQQQGRATTVAAGRRRAMAAWYAPPRTVDSVAITAMRPSRRTA